MAIPKQFITQLIERTDIVDVIGKYVELKKQGKDFGACCPFHSEKSASFTVSPDKQFYHCFGCGAHGDVIGFLTAYQGILFPDAVEQLAREAGMTVPKEEVMLSPEQRKKADADQQLRDVLLRAAKMFRQNLRYHPEAVQYMKARGLVKSSVNQFVLGYAGYDDVVKHMSDVPTQQLVDAGLLILNDDTGEVYDRYRKRVMFPIHDERGSIVGFGGRVLNDAVPKYINSPESPIFQKGDELYGLHFAKTAIRKAGTALVMEGYMDTIMLHQHGDARAVASLGTSLTERQLARLFKLCDEVIFCFDGDKAGRAAADRAAKMVLECLVDGKTAKFLTLSQDHDPDSYVRQFGIEAWMRCTRDMSIPLSGKIEAMLTAGRDMLVPESRAATAKDALSMIGSIKGAPVFAAALRDHIEAILGFTLTGRPLPRNAQHAGAGKQHVPVRNDRSMIPRAPNPRATFYERYALLCCMDAQLASELPCDLVDEQAAAIGAWFAAAPADLKSRWELASNSDDAVADLVRTALKGCQQRAAHLTADALANEAGAIRDAIMRDAERARIAARTSNLFN